MLSSDGLFKMRLSNEQGSQKLEKCGRFMKEISLKKFDRKPLESLFSMLESTLLKRKWGSKCYLVMVFYNEALK